MSGRSTRRPPPPPRASARARRTGAGTDKLGLQPPVCVLGDDCNRLLLKVGGDTAGDATGALEELGAVRSEVEHLDLQAGLPDVLEEPARSNLRRVGEGTGHDPLDARPESLRVVGKALGKMPRVAGADDQAHGTRRRKVREATESRGAAHAPILPDLLDRRAGKRHHERWIYVAQGETVEKQNGGVLIETCWLPEGALTAPFAQGEDGRYRALVPSRQFNALTLARLLARVAEALCYDR